MFHAKEIMFELLYVRKWQKCLKKPQKRNLGRDFENIPTVLDSNYFNTIAQ